MGRCDAAARCFSLCRKVDGAEDDAHRRDRARQLHAEHHLRRARLAQRQSVRILHDRHGHGKRARIRANDLDLVPGGTDNHLMLVDLRSRGITGKELQDKLDEVHITINKNAIPNDPQKPSLTSGVRIGTPAATTRGFTPEDMPIIAECIRLIADDFDANRLKVEEAVVRLTAKHPMY